MTIHYEKHGGFEEFIAGVWDVLPKGTPLVGGTVAGFMNNYGCYTRGCTAIAVSYPNMDVAVGIGHNTKRNPKKTKKNTKPPPQKNEKERQRRKQNATEEKNKSKKKKGAPKEKHVKGVINPPAGWPRGFVLETEED